ncbi:MAG: UMP kinase [Nanoarchaeota archaeon]|nr:UMP kinase [Nanoarchaeota archaeon]MBU1004300.1 UMP kinase [Nanoarchaeota archaeon]MBU1945482.1 UMP kinase [Nanoarchaeota archaeon]
MKKIVISLGGSVIIPDEVDTKFLKKFKKLIDKYSKKDRFIIICGGGKLARKLQNEARKIKGTTHKDLDWLGIYATRINALTLKKLFKVKKEIIIDPTEKIISDERVLIAAGWKPGFSTDYDAVILAKNIGASIVVNMTNVDYVYDKDPKLGGAKPIKEIEWKMLRKLVGSKWKPGLNMPFDPIASKEAEKLGLKAAIVGKDIGNLERFLKGKKFKGTLVR